VVSVKLYVENDTSSTLVDSSPMVKNDMESELLISLI